MKDFTFQVAQIRAIESRLLTQDQVNRMLAAPDASSSLRILNDLDWSEFLGEAKKPEEFEEVISAGLLEVKNQINNMAERKNDFDFIWLFFDLQNTKLLLKAFLKNDQLEDIRTFLSPLGSIHETKLEQIIFKELENKTEEEKKLIWITKAIKKAKKDFQENNDPEKIEIILYQAFCPKILQEAKKTGSQLMKEFFARMIDIENIKTFLRKKDLINLKDSQNLFIQGGELKTELFSKVKTIKGYLKKLPNSKIKELLQDELKNEEKISYLSLEKALDEYLFDILRPSKLEPFKADAIFAYFWTKNRNAEIIRAIMVGKLNHIPDEEIRKWLKKPSLPLV